MTTPDLDAVRGSYDWFGHAPGLTALVALHPGYRRGDLAGNRAQRLYPVSAYARSVDEVVGFVREYAGEQILQVLQKSVGVKLTVKAACQPASNSSRAQ